MTEHSPIAESPPEPQTGQSSSAVSLALPFFLALMLMFALAYGGYTLWRVEQDRRSREQAIPADYIGPALTEFELTERSGQPFRSKEMLGHVWVATYFFTACPGNCLRLNRNIQYLHNLSELKDVRWVSITCDPDTDTVEVLQKYADTWQADPARWLFCRADLDYTKRVAKGMKVFLSRQGHQDHAIVIDKTGKMRGAFDATSKQGCDRMRELLLKLLAEPAPQNLTAGGGSAKESS